MAIRRRGGLNHGKLDQVVANARREPAMTLLRDLCDTMTHASLCAMGGLTPMPVLSALDHFPEDFRKG